ncbi:RNA polymerase sigma factor [Conexibacter sp. SYSU D00693]|uniref:RNA polymerase sigma factor n=1 Tax=Conexibacter sp. SYSU D00693 TaxID=2812560 RepID=UPI00196B0C6D|nr:RNA polymerase sigma factor [Conexibacter sp. SYSU D00693]
MTLIDHHTVLAAADCAEPAAAAARPRAPTSASAPGDDAAAIARSRREPQAFAVVFDRHWPRIHAFCTARAGAAGEDIAAEAFRVAFARRDRYDPAFTDARPWLYGIATNLLREHFRSSDRGASALRRAAALRATDGTAIGADPLPRLEAQMLGQQLTAALGGLPAADRDALLLRAWGELDYDEIARALDIPIGTVRSRIHRARRSVRDHIAEHENEDDR